MLPILNRICSVDFTGNDIASSKSPGEDRNRELEKTIDDNLQNTKLHHKEFIDFRTKYEKDVLPIFRRIGIEDSGNVIQEDASRKNNTEIISNYSISGSHLYTNRSIRGIL